MKKLLSIISNLQTQTGFKKKLKMDQHTEGKLLMHGTKHRKNNQLQTWTPL